jgi:steroid 5-alpha reductase family enzyme
VLRNLRAPGDLTYHIPNRGLYRWISCPNYFGEILEWLGWAIATWSLPGLAFAIWTIANLAPRAHAHHAWYHTRFPAYPSQRKALIPYIW